ncbi:hypothetical protein INS49_014747 [Diaporthe citri]|uniref:uncharacterized protein n=1 Tax=Diaporthe citri TaxID=83186 RepID=UPI001C817956|nr:uncharacterized protein INS49_014747 [Diaporthe citri]KAG6356872.1 hypothetical protein INS49_014747 [Diaporthe citri]
MATADGDVEHLLATKTATPIAQLAPELPDQATRKVHGEVTITWPFSSVSKSVAFLLAEPDFRLRRDKGQVRIQLNGPSAEVVGGLELGSGDEVTLDLDGVEWARDEEPARPPGSRSDWQLKFVGKLTLKVTLGESQETKFINIDQPVPTESEEAFEPIPFAEIDTTIFDDEPPMQNNAKPVVNEYASPIFMKRSRASYAPLFEFDLDEELEADGGRRGKGRKRPRYSVQNGRWRYREESSSPEPEILQNSSSPASAQDGDIVMQDTPSKPQMADGACQTSELELPPPPQSVANTPSKALSRTGSSSSPLSGRSPGTYMGATTNAGVQASMSSLEGAAPTQQQPAATAGMIPPGVEDGTRNQDEMREQGILSQPVFEQGVPRAALPHGRESSADGDDDSMDSDEQADYDEDEKGDDYDMRNYDRISDDEEGFDAERGGPLPDEDLLEEDEDFDEDEEDYDDEEEDYEEGDYAGGIVYRQPIVQTAPPPQVQKEPIIIDLLSDSDDDEEEAPPPPQSQLGLQQMDGIAKSEPERHLIAGTLVSNVQPGQRSVKVQQESDGSDESDESAEDEEEEDGEGEPLSDDEPLVDENGSSESESDKASGNDGDMDVDEPTNAGASNDVEPSSDIEVPYRLIASVPEVEEADSSPGQSRSQSEVDEGSNVEETTAKVDSMAEKTQQAQAETGQALGDEDDAMSEDGHEADNRAGSSQPEPIDLPATFQTQSRDVAASFETQVMDSTPANISSSPLGRPPSSETLHMHPVDLNASFQTQTGDVAASFQSQVLEPAMSPNLSSPPQRQEPSPQAAEDTLMDDGQPDGTDGHRNSGSGEDASDEVLSDDGAGQPSGQGPRLSGDEPGERGTDEMDITPNIQNEASESKSFEGFSDDPQEAPPSPPESQHREGRVTRSMDVSMTTVSSHVETQVTDKEVAIIQTQDTEVVLSQPDVSREEKELSVRNKKVATTAEEAVSAPGELESDAESIKDGRAASHDEAQLDENEDLAISEAASEPLENEIVAVSSPTQPADPEEAEEPKPTGVAGKEVAHALSDEEDFHDASELLQMDESPSVAHFDDRASFVTANSQASESRETEEAESPSVRKSKRSSRIRTLREESNIQFAKPPRGSKRGSRVLSDQSPSPRTTRSQTMSFQKTESPTHEQEDMFARAGLRSPSRRKASATSANKAKNKAKPKDDLVKRLDTEMPECAPLKDLKSYNMNTLDIAAVVTSTNTTPQRTKARQYVSSFTICDPSTAPEGVIEVSLFRAHKDYLPVVKPGDSILLRHFTVTSLPDRGFGLRTEDESSWAVFDTDGEDATPQVRGPPVELSEKEKSYLVDLRAWSAALDEGAKGKLAEAVGEMVQKGKESRGEK